MVIVIVILSLLFVHFYSISIFKVFIGFYLFYSMNYLHSFLHASVSYFSSSNTIFSYNILSVCFLCLSMASEMD